MYQLQGVDVAFGVSLCVVWTDHEDQVVIACSDKIPWRIGRHASHLYIELTKVGNDLWRVFGADYSKFNGVVGFTQGLFEYENHQPDKEDWPKQSERKRRQYGACVSKIIEAFFTQDDE